MSSDSRIIKRYANRKLYDTQHSRYVTLDEIAQMIRAGDDVKIIDNKSKEDLTSVTLAQIIFEEEKKQRSFLPLQAMRNIIQHGGEQFSQLMTQAQKKVSTILPAKDEDGNWESEYEEADIVDGDETYAGVRRAREGLSLPEFKEWLQQSQHAVDEWQKKVDHRIRNAVGSSALFGVMQNNLGQLASRIAEIEAKLREVTEQEDAAAKSAESTESAESAKSAESDKSDEASAE
jgi:polyhydroxyalkanoate synthesis repressor PhaR